MSAFGPLITGAAAILPADPTGDSLESLIFDAATSETLIIDDFS